MKLDYYLAILGKDRIFNRLYIERNEFEKFDDYRFREIVTNIVVPSSKFRSTEDSKLAQDDICNFYLANLRSCDERWRFCLQKYTEVLF